MKYSGSITIVDDQGNAIFMRELGTDEIIDILIERVNFFQDPPKSGEGVIVNPHNISDIVKKVKELKPVPLPPFKKRKKFPAEKTATAPKEKTGRFSTKECCGSTGVRHFGWCKEMGGTGSPEFKANKSGRIPFSQSTYNTVKSLLDGGTPEYSVVSDKGLDPAEVKKIGESKSYDQYFRAK